MSGRLVLTDAAYRRSHMQAPRGRGSWAFQASRSLGAFDGDLVGDVRWFKGTFSEAKAAAREAGLVGVWAVLP